VRKKLDSRSPASAEDELRGLSPEGSRPQGGNDRREFQESPNQITPKRASAWYILSVGNAKNEIPILGIPRQLTLSESGLLGPIGLDSLTAK
jgi:hypothetical protein